MSNHEKTTWDISKSKGLRKFSCLRLMAIMLAAVFAFTAPEFTYSAYAASGTNVNNHTPSQIRQYINDSGVSFSAPTEFSVPPVKPTVRGALSTSSKQSALKVLNNIRYIAGLNPVGLDEIQGDLAQAAAFADLCVGDLTHTPDTDYSSGTGVPVPKPDGMSDTDWTDGNKGGRKTNLASGSGTMNRAVYHWTFDSDSDNIDIVGHRRWVLNPKMGTTGFGAAGGYYAMYSMDRSGTGSQSNVAWPAENMPIEYFSTANPWTLSTGSTVAESSVKVKLTRLNDGKTWSFSGAGSYSTSSAKYFNVNNEGYGQPGCIVFRPDNVAPSAANVETPISLAIGMKIGILISIRDHPSPIAKETIVMMMKTTSGRS